MYFLISCVVLYCIVLCCDVCYVLLCSDVFLLCYGVLFWCVVFRCFALCFKVRFEFSTGRSPFQTALSNNKLCTITLFICLSQCAQFGRRTSFRRRVWFTESHIVLVIFFFTYILFVHFILDIKKSRAVSSQTTKSFF